MNTQGAVSIGLRGREEKGREGALPFLQVALQAFSCRHETEER